MLPVPWGAARSYLETQSLMGLRPPLKYGPTGVTRMRNWYSSAGATPMTLPVANMSGRTYSVAPEPKGGTHAALALTTSLTASTNLSFGKEGISRRAAELYMRSAFMSGRKQTMSPFWVV